VNRRAYVTNRQLNELRTSLSANEWAVLKDVAVMRLAMANDLQRLQELRSPLGVRQLRRLLARLHEREVLFRLDRTVGGRARGSAGYVYGVGRAGHRLLIPNDEVAGPRPWTPRPSWLQHALAAGHLFVVLRELETDKRLDLVRFEAEPAAWRQFVDEGPTITLKPDAFVVIEHGDFRDSFFIEVDCDTESPTTVARKCEVYRRYWSAGDEQRRSGVFPQVLWLVPSDRRLAVLNRVIDAQGEASQLHIVARYDRAHAVFNEQPP
jgi:hypothetical protein